MIHEKLPHGASRFILHGFTDIFLFFRALLLVTCYSVAALQSYAPLATGVEVQSAERLQGPRAKSHFVIPSRGLAHRSCQLAS